MGAVSCIVINDRAVLWTDGGQYDHDGRLAAIAPNCLQIGDEPMVLAAQMVTPSVLDWHRHLEAAAIGIDQIVAGKGNVFDDYLAGDPERSQGLGPAFWLIGWSRALHRVLQVEIVPRRPAGMRLQPVRSIVTPVLPEEDRLPLEALLQRAGSPSAVDLAEFGLTLLRAQRRIPMSDPLSGETHFLIGGYVMQTEISVAGIQHEIIHQWDDIVGERTDPFGYINL